MSVPWQAHARFIQQHQIVERGQRFGTAKNGHIMPQRIAVPHQGSAIRTMRVQASTRDGRSLLVQLQEMGNSANGDATMQEQPKRQHFLLPWGGNTVR